MVEDYILPRMVEGVTTYLTSGENPNNCSENDKEYGKIALKTT